MGIHHLLGYFFTRIPHMVGLMLDMVSWGVRAYHMLRGIGTSIKSVRVVNMSLPKGAILILLLECRAYPLCYVLVRGVGWSLSWTRKIRLWLMVPILAGYHVRVVGRK